MNLMNHPLSPSKKTPLSYNCNCPTFKFNLLVRFYSHLEYIRTRFYQYTFVFTIPAFFAFVEDDAISIKYFQLIARQEYIIHPIIIRCEYIIIK